MVKHFLGNIKGEKGDPGESFNINDIEIGVVNAIDIGNLTQRGETSPIKNIDVDKGIVNFTNLAWYMFEYIELNGSEYSLRIKDFVTNPSYNLGRVQIMLYEVNNGVDGSAILTVNVEKNKVYKIDLSDRVKQTYRLEIRVSNATPYSGYIEKPMLVEGDYPVLWNYKENSNNNDVVELKVPTQFSTLQNAFNYALKQPSNRPINIVMEKDFKPSSGILMSNVNASNITIKSVDSTVTVSNTFTGDFISGSYSVLPTLDVLVDMNNLGGNGVTCEKGSSGKVNYNKGIKNALGRGCYVSENSKMYARASVFTGCHDRNVWVTRTSTFEGEIGDFSANKGGENAVYISRASTANLLEANISNAFNNGLAVIRSFVNAESVNASGAGATGIIAQRGSHIVSEFANVQNCGVNGLRAEHGTWVSGREMNASGCTAEGIYLLHGSKGSIYGSKSTGCGTSGLRVSHGSDVNATDCDLSGNTGNDIRCSQAGVVYVFGSTSKFNLSRCLPSVANTMSNLGAIYTD